MEKRVYVKPEMKVFQIAPSIICTSGRNLRILNESQQKERDYDTRTISTTDDETGGERLWRPWYAD